MSKRVLFLCTGNSCRSQMAEGLINHDFAGRVAAFSAGTAPKGLNPTAVQVMAELGIDISHQRSEHLSVYQDEAFDYVISLCEDADENCPVYMGGTARVHMGFDDPPRAVGDEAEVLGVYRRVRDEIREQIGAYLRRQLER